MVRSLHTQFFRRLAHQVGARRRRQAQLGIHRRHAAHARPIEVRAREDHPPKDREVGAGPLAMVGACHAIGARVLPLHCGRGPRCQEQREEAAPQGEHVAQQSAFHRVGGHGLSLLAHDAGQQRLELAAEVLYNLLRGGGHGMSPETRWEGEHSHRAAVRPCLSLLPPTHLKRTPMISTNCLSVTANEEAARARTMKAPILSDAGRRVA